MKSKRIILLGMLIGLGAMPRLLPHPDNFTPVLAIALFGGATLANRWAAIGLPIGIMLATDCIIIVSKVIPQYGLSNLWQIAFVDLVVYLAMALIAGIGIRLRSRAGISAFCLATIGSCFVFFILSNFASWLAFYDKSWSGFVACYTNAIPYFKNSVGSTILYAAVLFGGLRLAEIKYPVFQEASEPVGAVRSA